MKSIYRISIFIVNLLFSFHAYATTFIDHSKCPPTSVIVGTRFTGAMPTDGPKWGWLVGAPPITYNNKNWTVVFAVVLPKVRPPFVVREAQAIFNNILLSEPHKTSISDCTYEQMRDSWVAAFEGDTNAISMLKVRII